MAPPQDGLAKNLSNTQRGRDPWYGFVPRRQMFGPIKGGNGRRPLFDWLFEMRGSVVIDVGVWKGRATQYMAELIKRRRIKGYVIAIDTFPTTFEHIIESRNSFGLVDGRPDLMGTLSMISTNPVCRIARFRRRRQIRSSLLAAL